MQTKKGQQHCAYSATKIKALKDATKQGRTIDNDRNTYGIERN